MQGMGALFAEPAPFAAAALEALDIWSLMGNRLALEQLPVVMGLYPDCDAHELVALLRVIRDVVNKATA